MYTYVQIKMLPPLFVIRRYRPDILDTRPEVLPYKDIAVLIKSVNINNKWKLILIENPKNILENGTIVQSYDDLWLNYNIIEYNVQTANDKEYNINVKYNNHYIDNKGEKIPLLKISDPCKILPLEFYYLNIYDSFKFNFICGPIKQDNIIKNNIPPHILNLYIENIINSGECCPITMEPFTKENINITKCGHAISNAGEIWVRNKGTCPVCRETI